MSRKYVFFVLTGYQLTWITCIVGEIFNLPFIGFFIGLIYLSFFFYNQSNLIRALKIILIFAIIGYSFDSLMNLLNIYNFKSKLFVGYLPIWLVVLWLSFATLFVDLLNFLKTRSYFAILLGIILAPPTYYAGMPLGILKIDNIIYFFITMIIFWGLYLNFYSYYLRNFDITH